MHQIKSDRTDSQYTGTLTARKRDLQEITPALARWALYGPLRQALMRIASKIYPHWSD